MYVFHICLGGRLITSRRDTIFLYTENEAEITLESVRPKILQTSAIPEIMPDVEPQPGDAPKSVLQQVLMCIHASDQAVQTFR